MKNIKSVVRNEYLDPTAYNRVGENVYQGRTTNAYFTTLSFELEEGEDSQYPLEDILDRFYVNCTGYMQETENPPALVVELEGSLRQPEENRANITAVAGLAGKRVYNKEKDGRICLVIDP